MAGFNPCVRSELGISSNRFSISATPMVANIALVSSLVWGVNAIAHLKIGNSYQHLNTESLLKKARDYNLN
jgi:hypothetical protein